MNHQTHVTLNTTLLILLMIFTSGCTLKASTESFTDATTNFLSSTTPGAWFTVDGLLKPSEKINAFVSTNFEVLQQEMAQGDGEYLTALGTLLEIPTQQTASFKMYAQEHFEQVVQSDRITPQTFVSIASKMR